jgi:hypothetical protein
MPRRNDKESAMSPTEKDPATYPTEPSAKLVRDPGLADTPAKIADDNTAVENARKAALMKATRDAKVAADNLRALAEGGGD